MFTRKRTARERFSRTPAQIRAIQRDAQRLREQRLREQRRRTMSEHRSSRVMRNSIAEREALERRKTRRAEVEKAAANHPDRMVHCTVCNNFTHADHFCRRCGAHPAGSGRRKKKRGTRSVLHRRSRRKQTQKSRK